MMIFHTCILCVTPMYTILLYFWSSVHFALSQPRRIFLHELLRKSSGTNEELIQFAGSIETIALLVAVASQFLAAEVDLRWWQTFLASWSSMSMIYITLPSTSRRCHRCQWYQRDWCIYRGHIFTVYRETIASRISQKSTSTGRCMQRALKGYRLWLR
jgi:hypothetical protein